ncbi:hypothetical protein ACIQM3_07540 [Streptomyces sp. NPDC091271]|uniref:hypothetical protein n=1 Tax=Streptomyces sp. NPDC091271 TaxID=3365980 RepID=UPI0038051C6F
MSTLALLVLLLPVLVAGLLMGALEHRHPAAATPLVVATAARRSWDVGCMV